MNDLSWNIHGNRFLRKGSCRSSNRTQGTYLNLIWLSLRLLLSSTKLVVNLVGLISHQQRPARHILQRLKPWRSFKEVFHQSFVLLVGASKENETRMFEVMIKFLKRKFSSFFLSHHGATVSYANDNFERVRVCVSECVCVCILACVKAIVRRKTGWVCVYDRESARVWVKILDYSRSNEKVK